MPPTAPRKSQYAIAISSLFETQSAFGTALADGDIDSVVSLDDSNVEVEIVTDKFEIIDCTGEYRQDVLLMARSSRISYGFYAEGATLFGYLGLAGGVITGNEVTLLPPFEYQPAPTTLITGNRGSSILPLKFKDMVLDSIRITGRVANRITGRVQFRGHGKPTPVSGYTWPDCLTPDPIFLRNGAFSLDGVDRAADLREFDFLINNNLVFQEDPFPFNDVDIAWMERAERREWPLNVTLFGELNDATWQDANFQNDDAIGKAPFSLRIGSISDGITIASAGDALIEMANMGYAGQVARSTENLILSALRPSGEPSPIIITRNTDESPS
jgi:hypothetical protein